MLSVPVVDLSLLKGDKTQREKLFEDLRYAAHTIGFFYLVGHDVDWNLCQKLFALSKKFFTLPLEEKLKKCQKEYCLKTYFENANEVVVSDDNDAPLEKEAIKLTATNSTTQIKEKIYYF